MQLYFTPFDKLSQICTFHRTIIWRVVQDPRWVTLPRINGCGFNRLCQVHLNFLLDPQLLRGQILFILYFFYEDAFQVRWVILSQLSPHRFLYKPVTLARSRYSSVKTFSLLVRLAINDHYHGLTILHLQGWQHGAVIKGIKGSHFALNKRVTNFIDFPFWNI